MKFENAEVFNLKGALRGMRNPLESWSKSDSYYAADILHDGDFMIGEKDLDLAQRLIKSGPPHSKFLRQIFVTIDITAPLYW